MPKYFLNIIFYAFLALSSLFVFLEISITVLAILFLIAFISEFIVAKIILNTHLPIQPLKLNFSQKLYQDKVAKELAMAKRVQQSLLNTKVNHLEHWLIAKRCIPAESIGGDFFTFIERYQTDPTIQQSQKGIISFGEHHDEFLGLAIGDVAGHGISSALVMALSAGMFEEVGKQYLDPAAVLRGVNKDLCRILQDTDVSHVTAMYLLLDRNNQQIRMARAGHTSLFILKKETQQIVEWVAEGVYLGLFEEADFEEITIPLEQGDRIICFTDGITETRNFKDECFGLEAFKQLICDTKDLAVSLALDHVFDSLHNYRSGSLQRDDCSLVLLDVL